jgi:mannose-6-phosphate isomerase-like protein (cupin superfamily)
MAHAFTIREVQERLEGANGGYEIVHRSPRLEVGVYVLVAPEADMQQPHEDDEVYVVLSGNGRLEVEGKTFDVHEGDALFVEAGADHRFTGYESLALLVIFTRPD